MMNKYAKEFYDKLHNLDKEFIYSEYSRLSKELKDSYKSKVIDEFKQMLKDKLDKTQLNEQS